MPNGSDPNIVVQSIMDLSLDGLPNFDVSVRSGEFAIRDALEEVIAALGAFHLDLEQAGTVQIILAEVLNNILEHAYPPIGPVGPIHIRCGRSQDGVLLDIKDNGRAMPDGKAPVGCPKPVDVAIVDLPEGGFGWFLIKDLTHDVEYRRVGQENQLRLRIAFGATGRADPE